MKKAGLIKRMFCFLLIFLFSINSFAAVVSDNDGSAFITKAEFDSLKNNFQAQIDNYNVSIDSKIDGAIAQYLSGIKISNLENKTPAYIGKYAQNLTFHNNDQFGELHYDLDPTNDQVLKAHNAFTLNVMTYTMNVPASTYDGARLSTRTLRSPDSDVDWLLKLTNDGTNKWWYISGAENARVVWNWVSHTNSYQLSSNNNNSDDVIAYVPTLNSSFVLQNSAGRSSFFSRGTSYFGWRLKPGTVPSTLTRTDILNGNVESPLPSWAQGANTQNFGFDKNGWTELLSADWDTAIKHVFNANTQSATRYIDVPNDQQGRVNFRASELAPWTTNMEWGSVDGVNSSTLPMPDTIKYNIPVFYGPIPNFSYNGSSMDTNTRFYANQIYFYDPWGNESTLYTSPYFDKLNADYDSISFNITLDDATGYSDGILYMTTAPWNGNAPSANIITLEGTGARSDGGINLTKGVPCTVTAKNLTAGIIYFRIACSSNTKVRIKELDNYVLAKKD